MSIRGRLVIAQSATYMLTFSLLSTPSNNNQHQFFFYDNTAAVAVDNTTPASNSGNLTTIQGSSIENVTAGHSYSVRCLSTVGTGTATITRLNVSFSKSNRTVLHNKIAFIVYIIKHFWAMYHSTMGVVT